MWQTASGVHSITVFLAGDVTSPHVVLKRTAGTASDGTWTGVYTATAALADNFVVHAIHMSDTAGTRISSSVIPPYIDHSSASSQAGTITLHFTEGVKNVIGSTLSIYSLDVDATRYASTLPINEIACMRGASTVPCSGSDGLVTKAVLTVPAVSG